MKPKFINIQRIKLKSILSKFHMSYLRALGMQIGKGSEIGKVVCDWPNNVVIGDYTNILNGVILGIGYGFSEENVIKIGNHGFIGYLVEFNCTNKITIGDYALIATGTKFTNVGHTFKAGEVICKQPLTSLPIVVEDDVWIAANCVIIGGITIGKGSVVAAGSVVTKSIPPGQVWAGVPARFLKNRE